MAEDLVVVSNRGPISFSHDESGKLVGRQGGGGLVSSLGPLVQGTGASWVAAAMNDADREAAASGIVETDGFRYRCVALDPAAYKLAYNAVSNATLWFISHRLFDLARQPMIDWRWREAWDAYRDVNHRFADAVMAHAPEGATVLVQDYHLSLVGIWLIQQRPDLHAVHFTHTPFGDPNDLRVLPDDVAEELLSGMAAHSACGFHTRRWATAFEDCCESVLGYRPRTFVAPLAPDAESFAEVVASPACEEAGVELDAAIGDRRMILRVDRIELSKNILRGFDAYDALLRNHPEWVENVVFVALVYPSREGLPEYRRYREEVEACAARINETWSRPGWSPILLDTHDDFPRSVAALQRYDVLLINPVRDGLNLVAKEGPIVNGKDGVLLLSREAGAWDELSDVALGINPFDVAGTTEQLHTALSMSPDERRQRASGLRDAALSRTPRDWLEDQLAAARAHP